MHFSEQSFLSLRDGRMLKSMFGPRWKCVCAGLEGAGPALCSAPVELSDSMTCSAQQHSWALCLCPIYSLAHPAPALSQTCHGAGRVTWAAEVHRQTHLQHAEHHEVTWSADTPVREVVSKSANALPSSLSNHWQMAFKFRLWIFGEKKKYLKNRK